MAINDIDQLTVQATFGTWVDLTNEIITELGNVVTMGPDADEGNDNSDGITLAGPITTKNVVQGVTTNRLAPFSGNTIEIAANIELQDFAKVYLSHTGINAEAIEFNYIDPDPENDTEYETWRMGPHTSQDGDNNSFWHDEFKIIGRNAVGGANESQLIIEQASGATKAKITGTNIVLDSDLIAADYVAASAAKWNNATKVKFVNTVAKPGDVTGSFSIDGNEASDLECQLTIVGEVGDITDIKLGTGLIGIDADGNTITADGNGITTIANTQQIQHYTPDAVTTAATGGTFVSRVDKDTFGHVTQVRTANADNRYILQNPSSNAARTAISGSGLSIKKDVKVSFGDKATPGSQASLMYNEISGSTDRFEIVSPVHMTLAADDKIYFAKDDALATNKFEFDVGTGNFIATGDVTAFGTASDKSLKENFEPIENALEKVDAINGYTFNYIDSPEKGRVPGVIAQELEQVLPEAVYETTDGKKAVRYDNTVALLVEAIKELKQQVEELKSQIK